MTPPGLAALAPLVWPRARTGDALALLAARSGLGQAGDLGAGGPPDEAQDLPHWMAWAAARCGVALQSVDATVPEVPQLLRGLGPALLPVALAPAEGGAGDPGAGDAAAAPTAPTGSARAAPSADSAAPAPGLLVLLGRRHGRLLLLAPDGRLHRCPPAQVAAALCAEQSRGVQPGIDAVLDLAGVPPARRPRAADALRHERLATCRIGGVWMLRLPADAPWPRQVRAAGLGRGLAALLGLAALGYALEITAWTWIGQAALGGRLDTGWLAAWALALLALVPVHLGRQARADRLARDGGTLLKARLMAGALRLDSDAVRAQGVGQWLGRLMEAQALEALALDGGLAAVVALLELGFAAAVLAQGAAPGLHLLALVAWLGVAAGLAARHGSRLRRWVLCRLALTHDLVERMVGHRTRLAQERPAQRDSRDDPQLQGYLADSAAMDAAAVPLHVGLAAGWLLLALAALAPALLGQPGVASVPPASLAISLGGMLLAQRAFAGLAGGLGSLLRARVAWQQVRPLFVAGGNAAVSAVSANAAGKAAPDAPPASFVPQLGRPPAAQDGSDRPTRPLLDAAGLQFRHRPADAPLLQQVDLRIDHGDRLLLEGGSGAGKSTLAALLTGLRRPDAGLLLLGGWDRPTLGRDWQRLATAAPQFHENHVLSATLAFNLLMGRDWPPSLADLAEAEALCRALGLGDLLARMPAGLQQRVGETGWQLSHGERSRLFLARALLQRTPLVVLDESFAALDPATLAQCLRCTMDRADALLVIAHP